MTARLKTGMRDVFAAEPDLAQIRSLLVHARGRFRAVGRKRPKTNAP
jgi:hypothetical protein